MNLLRDMIVDYYNKINAQIIEILHNVKENTAVIDIQTNELSRLLNENTAAIIILSEQLEQLNNNLYREKNILDKITNDFNLSALRLSSKKD